MLKRFLPLLLLTAATLHAQQTPTREAAEWWRLTTVLSNDGMEGRDTGTEAYERAARYVADQFKASGLRPAGDNGTYFQRVPMHQVDLDVSRSSVQVQTPGEQPETLRLLYQMTLVPRADLPPLTEGDLVFIGYGQPAADTDLRGKIAVYFNNFPADLPPAQRLKFTGERIARLGQSGIVGLIAIDNPAAIEPTHWPSAYARSVTLRNAKPPALSGNFVGLRISAEAAPQLFSAAKLDFAKLLSDGEKGLPLPTAALHRSLRIKLQVTQKDISAPNVLAIFPGADARRATTANPPVEYVALSAHLDGYGYGTPVNGDSIYNGALDDAAYVATLLEFAHNLQTYAPKRSLLYCIFTGEEKGLLGSEYFTQHLTVPAGSIVADLNLDQLRPIFPLKSLTMEGLTDSTLGDIARTVAAKYNIQLRPDREQERNLFRRADNYSFVKIGVPIASFIFGYDVGTQEERIYRDWYARRYHKPQDDLSTPIDWAAAVKFNNFYEALALAVGNAEERPKWSANSTNAPGSQTNALSRPIP